VVSALLDHKKRYDNRFQYWEFYEFGFKQAVRWGRWKAVRFGWGGRILLFDMTEDIGEATDVASSHPEVVKEIETYLKTVRTESPNWPDDIFKNENTALKMQRMSAVVEGGRCGPGSTGPRPHVADR
jgi:hypothetical protein